MEHLLEWDEFSNENNLNEGKTLFKRKYTEASPAKHIYSNADKRNKVLSFMESKGGSVSVTEMKEFLSGLQENDGMSISKSWLIKNSHLISVKIGSDASKTYKLTREGEKVLSLIKSGKGDVSEEIATLDSTPGMGNVVPATATSIGSGDKFDNEDEEDEEELDESLTPEAKKELADIKNKAKSFIASRGKTKVTEVKVSIANPLTVSVYTETPTDPKLRNLIIDTVWNKDAERNKVNPSFSSGGSSVNSERIHLSIGEWKKLLN